MRPKTEADDEPLHESLSIALHSPYQIPALSRPEVMEDSIPMRLKHLCVRVEARVSELGDLLGEESEVHGAAVSG